MDPRDYPQAEIRIQPGGDYEEEELPGGQRRPARMLAPEAPESIADTGLPISFLHDLVLKFLFFHSSLSPIDLVERVALPRRVVDEVLEQLKSSHLLEVDPLSPSVGQTFFYRLTEAGQARAEDALNLTRYFGPAPVPLSQYVACIESHRRRRWRVDPGDIREALGHLVLSEEVLDSVGQAFFSGRAAIIYGDSGNGKTDIVTSLARYVQESVVLPWALFLDGQVIKVYDPLIHEPMAVEPGAPRDSTGYVLRTPLDGRDQRWVLVKRPVVVVGGEFTLDDLELGYDAIQRVYRAPASVQAQGGTLVIDDLGRQRARPMDILNRWIVPLERGFDTLVLQTGGYAIVPFHVSLILSTNMAPEEILDEAHLRRVPYKVRVPDPTPEQFRLIVTRACQEKKLPFTEAAVEHLANRLYSLGLPVRGCYARDILQIILEAASYRGIEPRLDPEWADQACDLYLYRPDAKTSTKVIRRPRLAA
jgi:energy-coupling factor transporter ATP-binding protein EcfA2